ncbi:MAG: flavodoxin family protein [Candidatus Bipolaricaulota bacterium]|nr:flavodoxin family protein [Candidatus Bipolaricaulota bacterium]
MNIGIIVYSQSGNTLSVAKRLKEKFSAAGHSATLEEVKVVGGRKPGDKGFQLETLPDVELYDALLLGSAVEGFSLSPVLTAYLKQIKSLQGKKVACLVTQFFPYPWMGGNRAVRQMRKLCESKGATVCGSGVVNWVSWRREKTTADAVDRLSRMF